MLTKVGKDAIMIDSVGSFGRRGRSCHSSSVTNGMNGWSMRKPKSRHVYSVCWDDFRVAGEAASSVITFIASYIHPVSAADNSVNNDLRTM